MIKVQITKDDPVYRGHTKLTKGLTGYLTKETQKITERCVKAGDVNGMTRVRFAASKLGYEGAEPIFCWVPNTHFKVM